MQSQLGKVITWPFSINREHKFRYTLTLRHLYAMSGLLVATTNICLREFKS